MDKLEVGKWVFLWVVLGQVGSLTVALCMRLMGKLEGKYENMELEEANRLHDLELQGISNSMSASQKVTNRNEDRWDGSLPGGIHGPCFSPPPPPPPPPQSHALSARV